MNAAPGPDARGVILSSARTEVRWMERSRIGGGDREGEARAGSFV